MVDKPCTIISLCRALVNLISNRCGVKVSLCLLIQSLPSIIPIEHGSASIIATSTGSASFWRTISKTALWVVLLWEPSPSNTVRGMYIMSTFPSFAIMSLEIKLQLAPVSIIALHLRLACFGFPTATRIMNCLKEWSSFVQSLSGVSTPPAAFSFPKGALFTPVALLRV